MGELIEYVYVQIRQDELDALRAENERLAEAARHNGEMAQQQKALRIAVENTQEATIRLLEYATAERDSESRWAKHCLDKFEEANREAFDYKDKWEKAVEVIIKAKECLEYDSALAQPNWYELSESAYHALQAYTATLETKQESK